MNKHEELLKKIENDLPEELKVYKERLLELAIPYTRVELEKVAELPLWSSNLNGLPYLPLSMDYPITTTGIPFHFFGQLNLEELPKLEGYPSKGILQFFVENEEEYMCGLDQEVKVVYHKEIVKDISLLRKDFSDIPNNDFGIFENENQTYKIIGSPEYMLPDVTALSRLNNELLEELYEATEDEEEVWDVLSNMNTENKNENEYSNHKIGGYPYFTQNDVLLNNKHFDTLLLQIDTDDENGIMWGDCGVGNFFIKKDSLQSLQFSDILFTWDCC